MSESSEPEQLKASKAFAKRRAEMGLTFDDVANQLKFAPRQIEALEAGAFAQLPGGTFARGMARSYAKLLKLDPEPLLQELVAAGIGPQPGPEQAVSLRQPIPFSEGGRHVNLVYMVLSIAILTVVAFYGLEWYQEKGGATGMAFVTPGRESSAPAEVPLAKEPAAPAAGREARPDTLASVGPAPVPETALRAEDKSSTITAPPLAPGRGRIVMHFDKESWVQIKARNGRVLLSQLNTPGSQVSVDGDPPFELTIGNAPSVHLIYNDQPVDLKPHFKVDVARLTLN
jgi:cytoskeleton protein RodZ